MSKGPGRIERAIQAAFAAEPDNAFTTEDLIDRVYPGANRAERKHRVAVTRAAKQTCERLAEQGWRWASSESLGRRLVFYNMYDVQSYAMGRLKTDSYPRYRNTDPRSMRSASEDDLRARLSPGGRDHHLVVEGGAWWSHVDGWIAERDGDHERAEKRRAQTASLLRALAGAIQTR